MKCFLIIWINYEFSLLANRHILIAQGDSVKYIWCTNVFTSMSQSLFLVPYNKHHHHIPLLPFHHYSPLEQRLAIQPNQQCTPGYKMTVYYLLLTSWTHNLINYPSKLHLPISSISNYSTSLSSNVNYWKPLHICKCGHTATQHYFFSYVLRQVQQ